MKQRAIILTLKDFRDGLRDEYYRSDHASDAPKENERQATLSSGLPYRFTIRVIVCLDVMESFSRLREYFSNPAGVS